MSDINVLALVKGEERYLFLFNDESRAETLRTLGKYASNPELDFSWYDAAVLSQKIRSIKKGETVVHPAEKTKRFELKLKDEDLTTDEQVTLGDELVLGDELFHTPDGDDFFPESDFLSGEEPIF